MLCGIKVTTSRRWWGARASIGFTLVELLVSMAVLTLLMVLTAQMIGHTTNATAASNRTMDVSAKARTVFDRFGRDFSSAVKKNGAAVLYYSGSSPVAGTIDPLKNSAIGFLCSSRARINGDPSIRDDVRGVFVGYKIKDLSTALTPSKSAAVAEIWRGDGAFSFSKVGLSSSTTNKWGYDLYVLMGKDRLANDISVSSGDENFLNWGAFVDGVMRLHISFVLDDGTIVQLPPSQNLISPPLPTPTPTFLASGGTGSCIPIAFTADTSSDPAKRYVTGLVLGMVILDQATLKLAYLNNSGFTSVFANQLKRPTLAGETPVAVWQANLVKTNTPPIFPPVLQNVRFYQRFFPATP